MEDLLNLNIGDIIRNLLGPGLLAEFVVDLLGVIVIASFALLIVIFLIWENEKLLHVCKTASAQIVSVNTV